MSYQPTDWKDRVVENPNRFDVTENPDGSITLTPKPGTVVQAGTPVNAGNMNKIEQGIVAASVIKDVDTGDEYKFGIENGLLFLEKVGS